MLLTAVQYSTVLQCSAPAELTNREVRQNLPDSLARRVTYITAGEKNTDRD